MTRRRFRFRLDTFDALRRRMIMETEIALAFGLAHPETVPRIPTIEVGLGDFHPQFAERFWARTLGVDVAEFAPAFGGQHPEESRQTA